jgi:hypothetical protein
MYVIGADKLEGGNAVMLPDGEFVPLSAGSAGASLTLPTGIRLAAGEPGEHVSG